MSSYFNVFVSAGDVGNSVCEDPDFLAAVFNNVGERILSGGETFSVDDFISELDEDGHHVLALMVAAMPKENV